MKFPELPKAKFPKYPIIKPSTLGASLGAAHNCNSVCKMDCYVYGCAEAGTPCCKLFGRLPDFGGAA